MGNFGSCVCREEEAGVLSLAGLFLQPWQSHRIPRRGEGEEMGSGRAAVSQRKLEGLQGWG